MNIAQFLEQRGHQQGLKQGLEQGLQQGIEQGIEQGEQQTAERIARAMLANGLDLSLVAKLTGRADRAAPALCFRQCVSVNHNKHEYYWR